MSIAQLRYQLETLADAESQSRRMAWRVLYAQRNQPLLVSTDVAAAQHAISFFIRNPLLRLWGKATLLVDRALPQLGLLPTLRLNEFPVSLAGKDGSPCPALYIGFPGPLQKLTLFCPSDNGELDKVTKVALTKSANPAIAREAHWLSTLAKVPEISPFLPRLLDEGTLACGRNYLSMQALPKGVSSQRFDRRHRHFLQLLADYRPELTAWNHCGAHQRLRERMQQALPLMDTQYQGLLQTVMDEVERDIGSLWLPTCLLHSDFAPWNVRVAEQHLYVFDWEYAEESGNPIQDFLHFHLIQRVLRRWPMGASGMPTLLSDIADYARTVYGEDSGVAEACGPLALHYLLDTLTFYTTVSGYLAPRHPVVHAYLELLRKRAEWMPQPRIMEALPHAQQQRAV
ncbi:MAG TPA: phosphotransferase [Methylophilaceae bacterium]|nr:phosphotransferase [Methylophilaceae bacterium]